MPSGPLADVTSYETVPFKDRGVADASSNYDGFGAEKAFFGDSYWSSQYQTRNLEKLLSFKFDNQQVVNQVTIQSPKLNENRYFPTKAWFLAGCTYSKEIRI